MSQLTFPAAFNDQLSQADGQFREGHFDSADELYSKLLSELEKLEDFENTDIGSLVLKIAESRYAAGAYEKAKLAYERLLALQEKNNSTEGKDRIFTLVKAARNYEKLDEQTSAQTRYEQAYELAKKSLPVKHFLRRTVFECYAQWLRVQKSNPLVLSILESELGTAPTPVAKEPESAPVEPTKETETRQERKGEEDFASMKSKLGQKRQFDKQPEQDPGSDASGGAKESKILKLPQSKPDKSLDKKVAARKFLSVFSGQKEDKVNKSRLKSALVEDYSATERREMAAEDGSQTALHGGVHDDIQNDEFLEGATAANVAEIDEVDQNLLAEAEALLKNLEIAEQSKPSPLMSPGATVENFDGVTLRGAPETTDLSDDHTAFDLYQKYGTSSADAIDKEMERLLAESARLLFNIESLNGPGDDEVSAEADLDETKKERTNSGLTLKGSSGVAMRHSERSYFGQEEEKEAKAAKFSLMDFIEKYVPSTGILRKVLQIILPLGVVVAGVWFAIVSNSNSKPEKLASAPKYMAPFLGKSFGTADGAITLLFKPNEIEIRGKKLKREPKIYFWQGTTNDELRLLQGTLKNCVWLKPSPQGLTTSDGQIFYAANAPETKVREVMNTIKTNALGFFAASGTYPNPEAVQPDRYVNPVTQRYEAVNTCSMIVGKERPKDAETRLDLDLENGQMFNNEPAAKPGAVSVFCVQLGDPNKIPGLPSAPGVPEILTTQSMYIHGFDRKGELLRTGADQKVLLIELKPTGPKNLGTSEDTSKFQTSDICFSDGEVPSQPAIAFKYGLIALLLLSIAGFFIWMQQAGPKEEA
ncbi:MAG: tetratricopeptide repeat protein [Cyanobacteria bacterium SZAS-4]|nr:tetratricopeptide repeat protein [Cyanobacteria bacterium SZAS-4]